MSWFPHTAPVVSLVLADSHPESKGDTVVDVFPHRWTPRRGFEDAILSFLAPFASNDHRTDVGSWYVSDKHTLIESGYTCDDFDYAPGAFVAHKGTPVGSPIVTLRMEGRNLHLPDGQTVTVRDFAEPAKNAFSPPQGSYSAAGGQIARQMLLSSVREPTSASPEAQLYQHATSFFLGVAEAFVASPKAQDQRLSGYHGGEIFAAIAARGMRNLAFVQRSGQDAVSWIYDRTKAIGTNVFSGWAVRPNRGWSSEHWVLGAFHAELVSACPRPLMRQAGFAAAQVFFEDHYDFSTLVQESVNSSAHGKIAGRFLRNRVEDAALAVFAADTTLLKPMAARKAAKLAAA